MTTEENRGLAARARRHRALGDASRLAIVELLAVSDHTCGDLRERLELDWNLLDFHLRTLEKAGLVQRRASEGDRRRRYVRLRPTALEELSPPPAPPVVGAPLFVCTHNSARSPFAAALWHHVTGRSAVSAGSDPAARVNPLAVEVAAGYDVDLSACRPCGYEAVTAEPDIVVSVCDRARERYLPWPDRPSLHWSVPDPPPGDRRAVATAFADIAERISWLTRETA